MGCESKQSEAIQAGGGIHLSPANISLHSYELKYSSVTFTSPPKLLRSLKVVSAEGLREEERREAMLKYAGT